MIILQERLANIKVLTVFTSENNYFDYFEIETQFRNKSNFFFFILTDVGYFKT